MFGQYIARNTRTPVRICAIRQIPNSDPKFHHPLIVDGAGKAINTHSEYVILMAFPLQHCIYLNINQLDALNFIMSLFHASTCFEHMCSSSGGQNCIIQPMVSSHL